MDFSTHKPVLKTISAHLSYLVFLFISGLISLSEKRSVLPQYLLGKSPNTEFQSQQSTIESFDL